MSSYEPGTYRKGDQARVANNKAQAVQAVFEGFQLENEPKADESPKPEVASGPSATSATPDPESAGESSTQPKPKSTRTLP